MTQKKEDSGAAIWNVFIPTQLTLQRSGTLIGHVNPAHHMITVLAVTFTPISGVAVIGSWNNSPHEPSPRSTRLSSRLKGDQKFHLQLSQNADGELSICLQERSLSGRIHILPVCTVLFSPEKITSSFFLNCDNSNFELIVNDYKDSINQARTCTGELIPALIQSLNKPVLIDNGDFQYFYRKSQPSSLQRCLDSIILIITWLLSSICNVFHQCTKPLPNIILSALITPATVQQIIFRNKAWWSRATRGQLQFYTASCQQLVDLLVGVSVCVLVVSSGRQHAVADSVMNWADDVVAELTTLVRWLMGAPAGLKLNAQLTQILGHFFLYHIYLWTGYLSILRSSLPSMLWALSLTGVLGVSFQLCLVQDVLSMLTLHIYCFYVYAARIFNLQTYALKSLWRLFQGKKWNVLRARVDTATHDTNRLFVGTLLFTVLLFLLPTTLLYYAVFTMLRLMVLCVQGVLGKVVCAVNNTPVFPLFLRILAPSYVAGSVKFTISQRSTHDEDSLVLRMQSMALPLTTLCQASSPWGTERPAYSWWELLVNLATGRLIYPWLHAGRNLVTGGTSL